MFKLLRKKKLRENNDKILLLRGKLITLGELFEKTIAWVKTFLRFVNSYQFSSLKSNELDTLFRSCIYNSASMPVSKT